MIFTRGIMWVVTWHKLRSITGEGKGILEVQRRKGPFSGEIIKEASLEGRGLGPGLLERRGCVEAVPHGLGHVGPLCPTGPLRRPWVGRHWVCARGSEGEGEAAATFLQPVEVMQRAVPLRVEHLALLC